MEKVSVAIASIGRETLLDTLRSLAAVTKPVGVELNVLVADDSKSGAATKLVAGHPIKSLDVTCFAVASGNISSARNALLDAADGDWLIFVAEFNLQFRVKVWTEFLHPKMLEHSRSDLEHSFWNLFLCFFCCCGSQ